MVFSLSPLSRRCRKQPTIDHSPRIDLLSQFFLPFINRCQVDPPSIAFFLLRSLPSFPILFTPFSSSLTVALRWAL
jgi:hypothetical protein